MSVLDVWKQKVGPRPIVNVIMELGGPLVLPKSCPCCCELADEGTFIVARCEGLPSVSFPACADCARHTEIEDKISTVMGPAIVGLTILTVAAFFFLRGMSNAQEAAAGSGWQIYAGLLNLLFPFGGVINAMLTALGAGAVLVVYLFVYKGVMHLILGPWSKASCKSFNQAARLEKFRTDLDGNPEQRKFIFENPDYATRFIKANGGQSKGA